MTRPPLDPVTLRWVRDEFLGDLAEANGHIASTMAARGDYREAYEHDIRHALLSNLMGQLHTLATREERKG